jgi:hypothetical protein
MSYTYVRNMAAIGGLLTLLSIIVGGFGELYVPMSITVATDATATAERMSSLNMLFRLGFATYLVEGLCNVILIFIFYVLLRPVEKNFAILAAFFGLVGVAVYAIAELFYLAPLLLVGDQPSLSAFTLDQRNALALLSLRFYGYAGGVLMAFGGAGSVIYGYLIFRSRYLPRLLGIFLALGGASFIVRNFLLVVSPAYAFDLLFLPMLLAMLVLGGWLLFRGIDRQLWEERIGTGNQS